MIRGLVMPLIVLILSSAPIAAFAQKDAKDHPLVSRFQGAEVLEYKATEFDEFLLPLGPILDTDKYVKAERLEGKVTKFKYSMPAGRSGLEVVRSYRDVLQKSGFQILFACDGQACIHEKFPKGYSNSASGTWCQTCEEPMRYLAAKLARPAGDAYVAVVVDKDKYQGGTWLTVVEVKPMASGTVTANAAALASDIGTTGHAPVYGIFFDTGKATLKPESDPTLAEIAKLLEANKDLKLHVIGHTDNVGTTAANMSLSKQRAEAVVAALISRYRIAATRLQAGGVGPLAPVARNRSEEGRAKNRRVELVEQ